MFLRLLVWETFLELKTLFCVCSVELMILPKTVKVFLTLLFVGKFVEVLGERLLYLVKIALTKVMIVFAKRKELLFEECTGGYVVRYETFITCCVVCFLFIDGAL